MDVNGCAARATIALGDDVQVEVAVDVVIAECVRPAVARRLVDAGGAVEQHLVGVGAVGDVDLGGVAAGPVTTDEPEVGDAVPVVVAREVGPVVVVGASDPGCR